MENETNREVTSLHGLIKVQRMEPPPTGLFVMCPRKMVRDDDDGRDMVQAEIEVYVLMSSLSPELATLVKKDMLENAPGRDKILETVHPDTRAEYEQMKIRHHELRSEIAQDTDKAKEDVDVKASETFTGNPAKMAVAIIEKQLGQPIPDHIETSPEALGDMLVMHGEEVVRSVAEAIKKETEVHDLIHKQGVSPGEAHLRVFGPPPVV